jgi:ribosome-binding factor A
MVSELRLRRISDRIREEISEMLVHEVKDPRLSGVFINDVTIDRELAYANIYFSAVEGSERADEILAGFYSASGFLRSELAKRVELRTFPRLRFHWDPTFEQAENIERLITTLHEESDYDSESDPGPMGEI